MSETPTSSLSLRLPVGVRAIFSGFMAFYEENAKQRPPIMPMDREPTRQGNSYCRKADEMDRGKANAGNRARQLFACSAIFRQIQLPCLRDEVLAEAVVRFFVDQTKACPLVNAM